jgi:hypothetical protein
MARRDTRPARPSKITVPERCDPRAKVVFAEMQRQGVTYDELEHRSGVLRSTFKAWRTNNKPGLDTIEAALGSLGWSLLPVPNFSELPETVREGVKELASKWEDENAILCALLASVCRTAVTAPQVPPAAPVVANMPPKKRPAPRFNPNQVSLF